MNKRIYINKIELEEKLKKYKNNGKNFFNYLPVHGPISDRIKIFIPNEIFESFLRNIYEKCNAKDIKFLQIGLNITTRNFKKYLFIFFENYFNIFDYNDLKNQRDWIIHESLFKKYNGLIKKTNKYNLGVYLAIKLK